MDSNNFGLLNNCLHLNSNDTELPLLDNYILNEIENEQNFFEIENFLSPVPSSNDSDTLPEFISISQNCSFESINLTNHSVDTYNSSESSTSEVYSPIEITPPETPPSSETSSNNSQINAITNEKVQYSLKKITKTSTGRPKKVKNELNKNLNKRKLLPLAPKIKIPTIMQLNNMDQQKVIHLKNVPNSNNNNLNYNLNNQNIQNNIIKPIIINRQPLLNQKDEKLSKEELSKIKEQARKLRNRQSAINSRQKKVEYVKSIEKKLEDITDENQNLRKENTSLKELVNKLNFENNQLKNKIQRITNDCCKFSLDSTTHTKQGFLFQSADTTKTKKTISLLAVIFLIGLNMNLYNDNFKSYETTKKIQAKSQDNVFKGRVLLWAEKLDNFNNISRLNNTVNNTVNCQSLISQNETIILESKLRNWAIHQTTKQHNYILSKNFNSNFANTNKLDEDVKKPWYFVRNWNQIDESNRIDKIYKQKQIYSNEELSYEQIISSVKPKDDTYYFLSLNPADHLILPLNFYSNSSFSKNGLLRPKFSLILPTFSPQHLSSNFTNSRNSTSNKSILQLIEIDFEVINMKPIQIYKNRFNSNANSGNSGKFKRMVRNLDSQAKVQSPVNFKPVKPILIKNQTVQSQSNFNRSIS